LNAEIDSCLAVNDPSQPESLAHALGACAPDRGARMVSSFQDRGDEHINFIHMARIKKSTEHASSSLDQHVGHGAIAQGGEQGLDGHLRLTWQHKNLATPILKV
jgi:hypothetical protein